MVKEIRIHHSQEKQEIDRYFYPRYVPIQIGEQINWINNDDREHNLIFSNEIPYYDLLIGLIHPGKLISKTFNHYVSRMDYGCSIHPEEHGTIIMYPQNHRGYHGISKPAIKDVNSTGHEVLPHEHHLDPEFITIKRFLDPKVYDCLFDPSYYEIHNKRLTIAFWDLSGFSTLCNNLMEEPATLMVFLKEYFAESLRVIHRFNGVVDKFIGDGIMAYFGFDSSQEYGANDAVYAAIELRKKFNTIRDRWFSIWIQKLGHDNISIELKCGINTGDILFGLLDMDSRYQITSIGSAVNLASRLTGIAERNEIIISKDTKDNIQNHFKTKVKNFSLPIKSFPNIRFAYEILDGFEF